MNKFVPGGIKPRAVVLEFGKDMVSYAKSNVVAKLSPTEQHSVLQLRQELAPRTAEALTKFGGKINEHTSELADKLLEVSKSNDIAQVGTMMTGIVTSLRTLNFNDINDRSKVPVIGKWIDKLKNARQKATVQFDTMKNNIDTAVQEADKSCEAIRGRIVMLEQLHQFNTQEYQQLRLHIVAAKLEKEQVEAEKAAFQKSLPDNPEPFDLQQISEATRYITNLGMTISNMELLEHDAIQYNDSVRMVQQASEQLLDKFGMIKKYTFPAWKKKFALALAVGDNQVGQEVANAIDDANNQLARDTATSLKVSSIASARANQRGVYDLSTIEFVNSELAAGADEVAKIAAQGDKDRQTISIRLAEMKKQRQLKLS